MLKEKLFGYQEDGVKFMLDNKKCLNLDECGLGKTAQAIGYIDALNEESPKKVAIVVKSENLMQWKAEIERFSDLTVTMVKGPKKKRESLYARFISDNTQILLFNYQKLLFDTDPLMEVAKILDAVVYDEAFALKNPESATSIMYTKFNTTIERVVALTATPMGCTLLDFYTIMRAQGIPVPEEKDFIDHFVETQKIIIDMGNRKIAKTIYVGSMNIEEFKQLYGKYFIRRLNDNKYDFALNIIRHPLRYSTDQKYLCYKLQQSFKLQDEEKPIPAVRVYSQFSQLIDSPALVDPALSDFSPKVEEILNILKSKDEQFVVFAKYKEFQKILKSYFDKEGIAYSQVNGSLSIKEKNNQVEEFSQGKTKVLLMTAAGKVGLNLQVARNLILVDVPSTPSDVFQFIGRVYRTGQTQDVNVHFLYTENSIESDLLSSLIDVQGAIDKLLDQNKSGVFKGFKKQDRLISFLKRDYLKM